MRNEEKLLRALCDALGFSVQTTHDYKERQETGTAASQINNGRSTNDRVLLTEGPNLKLLIDPNGEYTSRLKKPIVDYKLHPKIDRHKAALGSGTL